MTRAEAIARAKGDAAARRAAGRLEAAMRAAAPGVRVTRAGTDVTATGRALGRIAWPAGLLR